MTNTYKTSLAIKIEVTVDFDLTSATSVVYLVSKPNKTTVSWEADIDDEDNGVTSYVTEDGDLDVIGTYVLQPKVVFLTQTYFGDPISFKVDEIITV